MAETAAQPARLPEPDAAPEKPKHPQKTRRAPLLSRLKGKQQPRFFYASKDYVEHLRTIHFGLLAVTAGLLLLALSSRPYDPQVALRQISALIRLKNDWSPDWVCKHKHEQLDFQPKVIVVKDLARSALVRLNPWDEVDDSVVLSLKPSAKDEPVLLRLKLSHDFQWLPDKRFGVDAQLDRIPDRLDAYAHWWELLGGRPHRFAQVIDIERECTEVTPKGAECQVLGGAAHISDIDPDEIKKSVVASVTFQINNVHNLWIHAGRVRALLEIDSYTSQTVSQSDLLDLFPGSLPGDFATSFPDLYQATKSVNALDLESVQRYLASSGGTSEVFEAFGLKIPAGQVTGWGTVIILSIQLYLFLYLTGLKCPLEPEDEAWSIGWFAASEALLPRAIFFFTVWILPAATSVVLAKHAVDQRLQQVGASWNWKFVGSIQIIRFAHEFRAVPLIILGCFLSLLLGYLNWSYRPRVRVDTLPPSRGQLFE